MTDTIEVGTDWQSVAERDPKDVAAELDRLYAALRYARPIIVRWCYTQGNNAQFIVDTTKPIDDALSYKN